MANQKAIEKKQSEVSALAEKMKESKLVLLTDYRGISVCLLYTSPSPRDRG